MSQLPTPESQQPPDGVEETIVVPDEAFRKSPKGQTSLILSGISILFFFGAFASNTGRHNAPAESPAEELGYAFAQAAVVGLPAITGLALGIRCLVRKGPGRGMAIAGTILGAAMLLLLIAGIAIGVAIGLSGNGSR